MNLEEQIGFIVDHFEGSEFVNDPADPGGPTRYGVTLATLQEYRRRKEGNPALVLTADDVRGLTRGEAVDIGVTFIAVPSGLALILNDRLRFAALDYAYHSGPAAPIRALQTLVDVDVDGDFGPVSQNAVNRYPNPLQLGVLLLTQRQQFLQQLIRNNRALRTFAMDWWSRTTTNLRLLTA